MDKALQTMINNMPEKTGIPLLLLRCINKIEVFFTLAMKKISA